MPRPRKCRKVCQMPRINEFLPAGEGAADTAVILTVDEYEALRLIDREGFSQEECSGYMHVARTTVQLIYNSARKKLADALVEGRPLRIEGGDYQICDGREDTCGVPLDENKQDVCIVLSRAPYFLFRDNGEDKIVENPAAQAQGGAGIQAAQFLADSNIDVLITVRCGENAAEVLKAADIQIYKSVNKAAADDLTAWESGKMEELTRFHGGFQGVQ